MTDIRQSEEWAKFMEQIGWKVAVVRGANQETKVFVKKLPLLGSVIKIHRPKWPIPLKDIDLIAKKYRALFVKLQPDLPDKKIEEELASHNYQKDSWPLIPTKTVAIDLDKNENEILKNMKKNARYSIRRAQQAAVKTEIYRYSEKNLDHFDDFYLLLKKRSRDKKFQVQKKKEFTARIKAFKENVYLVMAYKGSQTPLAGALIFLHRETAYYLQAVSSEEGRQHSAPYLIVWRGIRLAKNKGCKRFDLEGIYDPRYKTFKSWEEFSVFKNKFGGTETTYPGAFIKYYSPIVKLLFRL